MESLLKERSGDRPGEYASDVGVDGRVKLRLLEQRVPYVEQTVRTVGSGTDWQLFFKKGQSRPLFLFFSSFQHIAIQI